MVVCKLTLGFQCGNIPDFPPRGWEHHHPWRDHVELTENAARCGIFAATWQPWQIPKCSRSSQTWSMKNLGETNGYNLGYHRILNTQPCGDKDLPQSNLTRNFTVSNRDKNWLGFLEEKTRNRVGNYMAIENPLMVKHLQVETFRKQFWSKISKRL